MMTKACCACLLLAFALSACAADAVLGRLFHTPAERSVLETERAARRNIPDAGESGAQRRQARLDGTLLRSDGRQVLWLDGVPAPTAATAGRHARLRARVGRLVDAGSIESLAEVSTR